MPTQPSRSFFFIASTVIAVALATTGCDLGTYSNRSSQNATSAANAQAAGSDAKSADENSDSDIGSNRKTN
jgi:hypothetical protein